MRGAPKTVTAEVPPLDLRADVGAVNDEARTADLIFSTGSGVERFDWMTGTKYIERLSLDPKAIKWERLNSSAPLLDCHNSWTITDQIGTVVPGTARVEKSKAVATVRFSRRESVEPIWGDVKDRIIRNVSVGYRVWKFEEEIDGNKIPVRTAVLWEPYEISLVPMGADPGARVRKDQQVATNACVIVRVCTDEDRSRRLRFARAVGRVA